MREAIDGLAEIGAGDDMHLVMLGGIKSLRDGRNEQGVPMLSKLPYISRLFKNVGIGREAQSLILMVTPRIIIQEEEEQNQVTGRPTTS
mgnify:CR=1 FL=1